MQKRWNIVSVDERKVSKLQVELGIHPLLCKMLVARGIESFDQAKAFFRPALAGLHSPWLMKDMPLAVRRILQAIDLRERILIYGDYDVDGTTAVALVYQFLQKICNSERLGFYVPHRFREGYGISQAGIDYAEAFDFTLVIALDCGIKSTDLIAAAKDRGIDFIVCDHHLPDTELPPAVAILNPKQTDCPYPYKDLCGCGIGFKLVCALAEEAGMETTIPNQYLDLVATAVAADIVPVTGENRILVHHGLKKINEDPCPGIRALVCLSGLKKSLSITNVVFAIAPRVNAAGRMDDAAKAVKLFIEPNYDHALVLAEMLHGHNSDRRDADLSMTEEALSMLASDEILTSRKSTVLFQPHWHKGVVGIVASRLIERYYRPTIVLTQSGDLVAGSARSVSGFNLYEAIHACREHLLGYGGHFAAAGMTLLPDQVDAFCLKFEEVVAATIHPDMLVPEINIDTIIPFHDLKPSFYNILTQMEPFGPGNMKPVLLAKNVTDSGWSKVVKEQHIRFSVVQDNVHFSGIGFNMADKFSLLQSKKAVDIVFMLDENDWNNEKQLQLKVIDFQPSES